MHIMFLVAIIGHLLCGVCDCLMTYVPGGKKFDFKQMSDNTAMKETFEKNSDPLITYCVEWQNGSTSVWE